MNNYSKIYTFNGGKLCGTVEAPVSKSDLHRLIICSALAFGQKTVIKSYTMSEDILSTITISRALGANIIVNSNNIIVCGITKPNNNITADCNESGSTLRFLLPVISALGVECQFSGKGRLPERPIKILLDEMTKNGAIFSAEQLPFTIKGQLKEGQFFIPGNISSQYISGLLMALPLLKNDSKIVLTSPLESRGYVEMTLRVLDKFGIRIWKPNSNEFHISGGQKYISPKNLSAEGDWSSAAFWLVGGALNGDLTVKNIQQSSLQGDKAICELLKKMGAEISIFDDYVHISTSKLSKIDVNGSQIPDIIPILSIALANANGTSKITNIGRLRIKESDRLSAIANILSTLNIQCDEGKDSLTVFGGSIKGRFLDSYNDHRIAMTIAVASLISEQPIQLTNPDCIKKSYPNFYQEFVRLGGKIDGIDLG